MQTSAAHRVFKSAWFAKAARKAHITDVDLCTAIQQVIKGQADDLGGGVFKKRVNNNRHRSIILARVGSWWIYQYLFAKKDRDNIDDAELLAFRKLAHAYSALTLDRMDRLMSAGDFLEICHDR